VVKQDIRKTGEDDYEGEEGVMMGGFVGVTVCGVEDERIGMSLSLHPAGG